eukprot:TRINITY_DN891_c0_g1_i1.p1 TRINITY_DN891_c0_g1~~TRINITY_DN891_c0_g1_i1.p1  ORF type:complete len:301 (+),score=41.35 TRINITY_DN891_c0_g1_i1:58-960(+)
MPSMEELRISATAGGAAGIAGIFITQPFDVLKVRQQLEGGRLARIARACVAQEGLLGLWKGLTMPCASSGVLNAALFASYETVMEELGDRTNVRNHAVAGAVAGVAATFVITPTELVKCIAQVDRAKPSLRTDMRIARTIVRREGPLGLMKGFCPTFVREVFSFALYFGVYEYLRQECGCGPLNAGGWAGVASWLFIYPMDTLKTQFQVTQQGSSTTFSSFLYSKLTRNGSVLSLHRSLFRGVVPCVLRAYPAHAVTFTAYEYFTQRRPAAASTGGMEFPLYAFCNSSIGAASTNGLASA